MADQPTTLVILAAGMGSRYGGLKQLDGMGPNGETLLEYSVYDAISAGFSEICFIIRESFSEAFKDKVVKPIQDKVSVRLVYQELDYVPNDYLSLSEGRLKPWGTGHALWCARDVLNNPFGVINADDYYGREALLQLNDFLKDSQNSSIAGMVGYELGKTLSKNGSVSRGIIDSTEKNTLVSVRECKELKSAGDKVSGIIDGIEEAYGYEQLVSMNCFGFKEAFLEVLDKTLQEFFKNLDDKEKGEFYLPEVLNQLTLSGQPVHVMGTDSEWMGVTYSADKEDVAECLNRYVQEKRYPENLW